MSTDESPRPRIVRVRMALNYAEVRRLRPRVGGGTPRVEIDGAVDVVGDDTVQAVLREVVHFVPEGPFEVKTEVVGRFAFDGSVRGLEHQELQRLVFPLLTAYAGKIVGFLTGEVNEVPLVVSPQDIERASD